MPLFVLLSKLPPGMTTGKGTLRKATDEVRRRLKDEVPTVRWKASYCVFGRYDVIDVFEAPDALTASKVATVIRDVGATTETCLAMPYEEFLATTD